MKYASNYEFGLLSRPSCNTGPTRNIWWKSETTSRATATPTTMMSRSASQDASSKKRSTMECAKPGSQGTQTQQQLAYTKVQARAMIRSHDLVPSAQRATIVDASFSNGKPQYLFFVLFELFSFSIHHSVPAIPLTFWKCLSELRALTGCMSEWRRHQHQWEYDTFLVSTLKTCWRN